MCKSKARPERITGLEKCRIKTRRQVAKMGFSPEAVVFVRMDPICFLTGCHKRRLNQGEFSFVRFSFWDSCVDL